MDDEELAALRAQRMSELQGQQDDSQAEESAARNGLLSQILDQAARARLSNLAVVKPEKAKAVENMLLRMAQTGRIMGKVSESQFKDMLEQVSAQSKKKTTVKFQRRPLESDSSSDSDSDSD